ncbi:hypothetical protein HHL23_09420 [Chryseobacterium sp. RP-3-3]|uniref:Uncharacterized protein n=1 Tax=Chryseobacterium antibioticum TaxID=2728847 RepID=A0A7Y0FS24_9FLAO|nr:hypothetical protein [Chryseobacterium antibioticum]NML70019.1 hypothetical protein [Chryseobacterium antibioticum]
MNKTIKLKSPAISEWIYTECNSVGKKQDGLKSDTQKFHISELSQEEAQQYAEEYKKTFLEKYHLIKK